MDGEDNSRENVIENINDKYESSNENQEQHYNLNKLETEFNKKIELSENEEKVNN